MAKIDQDIQEKFDWVVSYMVIEDRFCFEFLACMDKVSDKSIETMGVRPTVSNVQLRFNPEFVRSLSIEELRYVLAHEVMHVALHHITKRAPKDKTEHRMFNIAADLAINSLIKDDYDDKSGVHGSRYSPRFKQDITHPITGQVVARKGERMGCFPGTKDFPWEAELSMDNYLALLRDKQEACRKEREKQQKGGKEKGEEKGDGGGGGSGEEGEEKGEQGDSGGSGKGGEPGDDTGDGGSGSGKGIKEDPSGKPGKGKCTCGMCQNEEEDGDGKGEGKIPEKYGFDQHDGWEPNEIVDEAIRRVVDEIQKSNSWGSMSAGMIEKIKAAQKSEVPWRRVLRHHLGALISAHKDPTIMRPNRRYGYPLQGNKRRYVDRKLVAIDTSGSVGSKDLAKFLTEINALALVMPVDLMLFDMQLQYKKAIPFDKKHANFDFDGRGGTDFRPVFKYAEDNRYKDIIVLTDGGAPAPDQPKHMSVLWVITPGNTPPCSWGKCVTIRNIE